MLHFFIIPNKQTQMDQVLFCLFYISNGFLPRNICFVYKLYKWHSVLVYHRTEHTFYRVPFMPSTGFFVRSVFFLVCLFVVVCFCCFFFLFFFFFGIFFRLE